MIVWSGQVPGTFTRPNTGGRYTPGESTAPVRPDLALESGDLTFTPTAPAPGNPVTISARVRNQGLIDATNVLADFADFGSSLGQVTIPSLPAGSSTEVSVETTYAEADLRLITVQADPNNAISEINEDNNEASKILQIGEPDFSTATMVVQASSAATCQGEALSISGQAYYDFAEVPGENDHPVQGGKVTVTILDPATNQPLATYSGATTRVDGSYNQGILAPSSDGTYPVLVSVTDKTITQETQTTLTVSGSCETPPPPPPPPPGSSPPPSSSPPSTTPGEVLDAYVRSEDIYFSTENPDPAETISLLAHIHYYGSEPAFDIPVTLYDVFPVDGVLRRFTIGSTEVSFPNGGGSSPQFVNLPWSANPEGAHVIQVVVEPPFDQFTGNDKATRLIVVGDPPQLALDKQVALLVDADGNGLPSPGDTLEYTITYENTGAADVSGAVISDDYDESLVGAPAQVSDGGVESNGALTWNLGDLSAGASGSVSYQVTIKPESEFPSGLTPIDNVALLSTDQTPAIAASNRVQVVVNVPPSVDAGPDQTVDEGSTVTLNATGADYEGGVLTYEWDLDNDGVFEASGQSASFLADDGPASHTVTARVTDEGGLSDTDQATITVTNIAPTADFANSSGDIDEGQSATVSFGNAFDPGADDTAAGFSYSYDCTNDGTFEATDVSDATFDCPYPDNGTFTVLGRIKDKDGGFNDYTTSVVVHNVAPTVGSITAPIDPVLLNSEITTGAGFTDPGVLDTHTAEWDWGDGTTSVGTVTETDGSGSVSGAHSYDTPGVYTIKLTVTDKDGGVGESTYQFVVVYDPEGGFVTGGGWFDSPEGAYAPDPALTGKANFGFVAKYKKGANTPDGNTQFQFKAGDLNFHSSEYEWLVVAGARAQFKGYGTINGSGDYGFLLTAIDGQVSGGGGEDKFRIKIWDKATGEVIYDNQMEAGDDADPTTVLGGGSIVIHK